MYYILIENKPVLTYDFHAWVFWMNHNNRVIKHTNLPDGICVTTMFLGIDNGWSNDQPILFETLIFGGEHNDFCERYSDYEMALSGHERAIEMIFEV